jgi:hypothetical protein
LPRQEKREKRETIILGIFESAAAFTVTLLLANDQQEKGWRAVHPHAALARI